MEIAKDQHELKRFDKKNTHRRSFRPLEQQDPLNLKLDEVIKCQNIIKFNKVNILYYYDNKV